ncbi:MAG: choice-of-anchor E domain-containing protein [Gemmataceae bacterium]
MPLFDPSLGQLTKVEIIAEGGFQSNVMLENLEGAAQMEAKLKGSIRYQVGGTTIQASPERKLTDTVAAFDGTPDLQGASARDFGVTQLQGSFQSVTLTNPGDISGFVGQGTIGVTQNASMEACACGTGNLMAMIRSTAQGKVRVVYHYQPGNEIGPGSYKIVQVNQPPGFTDGFDTRGNQTPIPNSNRTDFINVNVVNVNDVVGDNCFGEVRASSVAGKVYVDNDRSTRFSSGDTGIAGVSLTLRGTDVFGRSIVRTTTTDAAGNYRFGGLAAGSYTITETQPGGYQQGSNNAGSSGGTVAGDSISLRLGQAVHAINYNFGEVLSTPGGGGSNTDGVGGKGWFIYTGGKTWTW